MKPLENFKAGDTIIRVDPDGSTVGEPFTASYTDTLFQDGRFQKVNQKQFKKFSPAMFAAYVLKFSDKDKGKMFRLLFDLTPNPYKHEDHFQDNFYMAICRAYNAGKQSILDQNGSKEFVGSDEYYNDEFGK